LHYHASTQILLAIVLQRDKQTHTMLEDSICRTDILIGQSKIDSGLTNQLRNQNKALHLSGDPVR